MTLKDILIAGKLTISEGGGGGGSVQTASGTFNGDDSLRATFDCPFDPDVVFVKRIDTATLTERVFGGFIGGKFGSYAGNVSYQVNANTTTIGTMGGDLNQHKFSYADGKVKIDSTTGRPVSSQAEYGWYAVKWTE